MGQFFGDVMHLWVLQAVELTSLLFMTVAIG